MPRGTTYPKELRERAVRMVAEIGEPQVEHELAGLLEIIVELQHERHHLLDPFRRPGLHHRGRVAEHHEHVLHFATSSIEHPERVRSPVASFPDGQAA